MAIKVLQNTDYAVSHSDAIKMKNGGLLTHEHKKVVDASISSEYTETTITLIVQNGYWTYENEQPVSNSASSFRYCIIDVSKYDAIKLKMQIASTYGAKCFFANDNGVKVGDYLYNTTRDFVKFIVPAGATKVYYSSNYDVLASVGAIGIKNETALELIDKTNGLLDLTLTDKEGNIVYPSSATVGFSWEAGKWIASSGTQMYFVPYTYRAGDRLSITGGADASGSYYTFLTEVPTPAVGEDVPFATDTKSLKNVAKGQTVTVEIPSNCGCIVIHKGNSSNANKYLPSSLKLIRKVVDAGIDLEAIEAMSDDIDELNSVVYEDAEVDSSKWIQGSFGSYISSGKYVSSGWDKPKFVPIEYAKKIVVTTGEKKAIVCFVTDTAMVNGGDVPFAEGDTTQHAPAANGSHILDVPSGAKYLYCGQKLAENWQFPISVVCKYTADTKVEELKAKMYAEVETLDNKKQDKVYYTDLSNSTILEGRDLINNTTNAKRVCIQNQKCYKGDTIKTIPNAALGHSSQMLVRVYNRNMVQLAQTAWVTQYTIPEDGYYIATIESVAADGGTRELFLNSVVQCTSIEVNTEKYLSERWERNGFDKTLNRLFFDDGYKVYPYVGESPFKNMVRMKYLGVLSGSGNQSMAFYGDYLFTFSKGVGVVIFDLAFNKVGQIANIEAENTNECNAAYFSDEFVDPADEFPIVYVETIYTTPYVKGYRIRRNNGIWSIEMVHEINTEVSHGNLVIYDRQNDDLIYATFSNNASFYRFHRPKYADSSDGVSTLMETDMVSAVPLVNDLVDYYAVMGYRHDVSVCGNIAFGLTYNMESPLNNRLFGVDLTTGKTVFFFPFAWSAETECLEWYCGRLYFKDNGQRFYELIIEGGNIEPFSAGARRPTSPIAGYSMFDTNLGKPIWYTGSGWVDKDGFTAVLSKGTTTQRPTNTLSSNDEGYCFFDTTLGKPIYFKIINNVKVWVEEDGARAGVRRIGMTEQRPSETDIYIGFQYYDTTLGKVVVWNDSWV